MSFKKKNCVYMSYKKNVCVYMSFKIKRHIYTSVISWCIERVANDDRQDFEVDFNASYFNWALEWQNHLKSLSSWFVSRQYVCVLLGFIKTEDVEISRWAGASLKLPGNLHQNILRSLRFDLAFTSFLLRPLSLLWAWEWWREGRKCVSTRQARVSWHSIIA